MVTGAANGMECGAANGVIRGDIVVIQIYLIRCILLFQVGLRLVL